MWFKICRNWSFLFHFFAFFTLDRFALANDQDLLPKGPGLQDVLANCIACHSSRLIIAQKLSRQSWLKTIRWMQEKQNLWPIEPEAENRILSYLETYFGLGSEGLSYSDFDDLGPRPVNPLP